MATSNIAKLGRWALLAATLLMGGALFFTVFWTYRGVETATTLLLRGQADLLHDGVRSQLGRQGWPLDAELGAVLESLQDEGLIYVAAVAPDGKVLAEAGKPIASRSELERAVAEARGAEPVAIEGRMRAVFRGPPRRRLAQPGLSLAPRPAIVIEFEPRASRELSAAARSTLAVGALAAGAFLVLALGLVRWLIRSQGVERRLEHERRLASLGRMSATLAHEIRNPLASLKGNAQLLARALPEGDPPRAKAELVVTEAVRLELLVNDLLEFARAGEIHRVDADPGALVREVVARLEPERVTIVAGSAPSRWRLDPERMRQVVSNLVENALQAGDGRVEVTVAGGSGRLAFVVRDRGPGIAAEDLERIFEPFFTRRTRGTGLGLSVARRLVELHGGTLSAENAEGGGAVFTVHIPR